MLKATRRIQIEAPNAIELAIKMSAPLDRGVSALGEAMDPPVPKQVIHRWLKRGWIPDNRLAAVSKATGIPENKLRKGNSKP